MGSDVAKGACPDYIPEREATWCRHSISPGDTGIDYTSPNLCDRPTATIVSIGDYHAYSDTTCEKVIVMLPEGRPQ